MRAGALDISCKMFLYDSWGPGHLLLNTLLWQLGPWTSPAKYFVKTAGSLDISCKILFYDSWGPAWTSPAKYFIMTAGALDISCKIFSYDTWGPGHLLQNTLLWQQGPWKYPAKYVIMTSGALDIFLGPWSFPAKYFIMTAGALDIPHKILYYDSRGPGHLIKNILLWQQGPWISPAIFVYDHWDAELRIHVTYFTVHSDGSVF